MLENFDYKGAWVCIKETFPILNDSVPLKQLQDVRFSQNLETTVEITKILDITEKIQDLIINTVEDRFRKEVAPEFWSYFQNVEDSAFKQFYCAVNILFEHYTKLGVTMEKLERLRVKNCVTGLIYNENNLENVLRLICKATLLSQLPLDYQTIVFKFYETALKMGDLNDESINPCPACSLEGHGCDCGNLFQETNMKLSKMSLLEPLASQSLTDLIYNYINAHIQKICKDSFDTQNLENLIAWQDVVVTKWLKKVYSCDSRNNSIEEFEKKLENYLYNTYTKIRIDQLFTMIIEYPESMPALLDLRFCLSRTDQKSYLIKTLQKAMETRLLHPGVSTSDVLTAYVATIRSLRILDPSGIFLETVTQPVHHYLRSREDTIRCVVSNLTEEGPSDLGEELGHFSADQLDENAPIEEDTRDWETWTPDPVNAIPFAKTSNLRRTSDIISMLVNVYGSKDLFVSEYRTLLADRLLSQYSDTEKEIRHIELLKLRFGDSSLHYCEVMMKDIADSKRINQNIKQDETYTERDIPMTAMILSAQFWPPFKEEKLNLHSKLTEQMEKYTKAFETLKGSRTLCWKNHLGVVDMEIELADRTLNLTVSPIHATLLMHFHDQKTWNLDDLSKVMLVPPTTLRRKLGFWKSQGIITETESNIFMLQEGETNDNNLQDDIVVEDYESESAMASAQDQREEELQTFWSYILGMLMNLDTLPLERIHQMLKMFAFQGPTIECNIQELKVFLDRKVREHQLIYSNGLYKLPK